METTTTTTQQQSSQNQLAPTQNPQNHQLSFSEELLVLWISSSISQVFGSPIDRIRVLIQGQPELIKSSKLSKPYTGGIDCFQRVRKTEGLLSLWKGFGFSALLSIPQYLIRGQLISSFIFKVFDLPKENNYILWFLARTLSISLRSSIFPLIWFPIELVRIKYISDIEREEEETEKEEKIEEVEKRNEENENENNETKQEIIISEIKLPTKKYSGVADVILQTWRKEGTQGFYKGLLFSLCGSCVYSSTYFILSESFKYLLSNYSSKDLVPTLMFGSVTVIVAGTISYPFQTLMVRRIISDELKEEEIEKIEEIQDEENKQIIKKETNIKSNFLKSDVNFGLNVLKKEGIRSLFSFYRYKLGSGLMGVSFTALLSTLQSQNDQQ